MTGSRSTDPIRANGMMPRKQAGHMTAGDRPFWNAKRPLPAGRHPQLTRLIVTGSASHDGCVAGKTLRSVRRLSGLDHVDRCLPWWRWLGDWRWCAGCALQDDAATLVGAAGLRGEGPMVYRLLTRWRGLLCGGLGQRRAAGQCCYQGETAKRAHGGVLLPLRLWRRRCKHISLVLRRGRDAAMIRSSNWNEPDARSGQPDIVTEHVFDLTF